MLGNASNWVNALALVPLPGLTHPHHTAPPPPKPAARPPTPALRSPPQPVAEGAARAATSAKRRSPHASHPPGGGL